MASVNAAGAHGGKAEYEVDGSMARVGRTFVPTQLEKKIYWLVDGFGRDLGDRGLRSSRCLRELPRLHPLSSPSLWVRSALRASRPVSMASRSHRNKRSDRQRRSTTNLQRWNGVFRRRRGRSRSCIRCRRPSMRPLRPKLQDRGQPAAALGCLIRPARRVFRLR